MISNGIDQPDDEIVIGEPDMIGNIYSPSEEQILVAEGIEGDIYTGDPDQFIGEVIWLTIGENTEMMDKNGLSIDFGRLTIGSRVEVWVDGPVIDTYPSQGTALRIVLIEDELLTSECFTGGCSGELCSTDPEAVSTCELLPGMECLGEGMACEFISNECTWVLSEESALCFMEVEEEYGAVVRESRIGYLFQKAEELIMNRP
jgi:eight-cysteine-cluster-containing protein